MIIETLPAPGIEGLTRAQYLEGIERGETLEDGVWIPGPLFWLRHCQATKGRGVAAMTRARVRIDVSDRGPCAPTAAVRPQMQAILSEGLLAQYNRGGTP